MRVVKKKGGEGRCKAVLVVEHCCSAFKYMFLHLFQNPAIIIGEPLLKHKKKVKDRSTQHIDPTNINIERNMQISGK